MFLLLLRRQPAAGGRCRGRRPDQNRTFLDARVKWVRDRALDRAVEKEKHLLPFHNLKDLLLLSSSSHSLPLHSISSHTHHLLLPFRPLRFIRLFPSAFHSDHAQIHPTQDLLLLHSDEQQAISSSLPDAADRLLRLLMLTPRRRLPLRIIDRLRWDLGLPRNYPRSLLPNYPDYFHLVPAANSDDDLDLELVLYRKDLAVSAMERYAARNDCYKKGMPIAFRLQYPRGFDLEKKVKNWVEEWQKLPYISPYEDGSRLPPKSDFVEKWTVGMLHELLSLFIGKKTEKENLVMLSEHVGLGPGLGKVITHYPGIFYVPNKLRTQTVVLREAYHRDRLLEKHPLMGLRYQYIHLMHKGKETDSGGQDYKLVRMTPGSMDHTNNQNQYVEDEDEDGDESNDDEVNMEVTETEDDESDDEDVNTIVAK